MKSPTIDARVADTDKDPDDGPPKAVFDVELGKGNGEVDCDDAQAAQSKESNKRSKFVYQPLLARPEEPYITLQEIATLQRYPVARKHPLL